METKKLESVRVDMVVRVQRFSITKPRLGGFCYKAKPTFCVEVVESDVEEAVEKGHYWLKGACILGKGQIAKLSMKLSRCEGYGYRVMDWKYA